MRRLHLRSSTKTQTESSRSTNYIRMEVPVDPERGAVAGNNSDAVHKRRGAPKVQVMSAADGALARVPDPLVKDPAGRVETAAVRVVLVAVVPVEVVDEAEAVLAGGGEAARRVSTRSSPTQ
jgi:hypothetical protein